MIRNTHITLRETAGIPFTLEWNMIVVPVFVSILNRIEFCLFQNQTENCHTHFFQFTGFEITGITCRLYYIMIHYLIEFYSFLFWIVESYS